MSKNTNSSGGIGFLGFLTILFIALKLTGFINWSWWFVLAPTLIPLAIGLIILLVLIRITKE
jgi:hypothetical protein